MAIPFEMTHITITRVVLEPDSEGFAADPYDADPPDPITVERNVRAVISTPSASSNLVAGDRITYSARLTCDPCDIRQQDTVMDHMDGTEWTVLWVRPQQGLGMDHLVAQLRMVTGAAA